MMAPTFITKLALSLSLFSYALTVTASPSASAAIQASHAKRHHDLAVKRNATESTPPHPARSHHTGRSPKDADAVQYDEYGRTIKKRGPALRFDYAGTKVRGVNLGGWLVLEPFITPTLFQLTGNDAIVDEYTFCQYQAYDIAHAKLLAHWETWITEADIWAIKAAGLNHVRIPIGYWAYDTSAGEPYHKGADVYLRRAIDWAGKAGLKVWIDLHGAPGSQNGFDNSGQRISYPLWHTQKSNIERTSAIIKSLSTEYSQSKYPHVTAIAPLNEPAGFYGQDVLSVTRQYWYDSYGNIRYPFGSAQQGDLLEVIHDTFQPLNYWNNFASYPTFEGVALDTHIYEVFSNAEVARTWGEHISNICRRGGEIEAFSKSGGGLWTVVGEWSNAAYDCAQWLNGRGVGSRYDGTYPGSTKIKDCAAFTGNGALFADKYKVFLRKFWEAQVISFEKGQGWIYWTWKTESADEWSYSAGIKNGWIPQNPTERKYPNICG